MEKEFVTYEQALALKELGFDEPCFGTWDRPDKLWAGNPVNGVLDIPEDNVLAPLYQQAFRWFREKHKNIKFKVQPSDVRDGLYNFFDYEISIFENKIRIKSFSAGGYESNEEAELACLDKLIEICKNKQI